MGEKRRKWARDGELQLCAHAQRGKTDATQPGNQPCNQPCNQQKGETIDGEEEEEMGKRRRTATSRACAEKQDGCNTTRQRRPAPKLMYASADGRQTVPCRPQIKRAFDKMQKSAESRITKILLVAFHFPKSHNCIGASTQNVSFLELTISSMSPNKINLCDLFQIL